MKMIKINRMILALVLAVSLSVPAFALEGGLESPVTETPGESIPADEEPPEEDIVPESPEESDQPETPASPESPEIPEVPETPDIAEIPPIEEMPVLPEEVPAPILEEAEAPIINVTVPETGSAIINPYGLPVEVNGQETTEQIAGSTLFLENHSSVAVDVGVTATGMALGDVVLTDQPPAEDSLEKALYLYA